MSERLLAAVLLSLAAATLPAEGAAQPFLLSGKRVVRVGGTVDEAAKVYLGAGSPRALVLSPVLGAPVFVSAADKTATVIDAARVQSSPDDPDAVLVDAEGMTGGSPLSIQGLELRFQVDGKQVVLESKPLSITGVLTAAELLAAIPEYRHNARSYAPGKGDLRLLATLEQPTEIDVFFGTWCPHCEQNVPRLVRVDQELSGPALTFRYHALPERVADDPLARQYQIKAVPTALVRRGDQVLARIEGSSFLRPEAALSAVLVAALEAGK